MLKYSGKFLFSVAVSMAAGLLFHFHERVCGQTAQLEMQVCLVLVGTRSEAHFHRVSCANRPQQESGHSVQQTGHSVQGQP